MKWIPTSERQPDAHPTEMVVPYFVTYKHLGQYRTTQAYWETGEADAFRVWRPIPGRWTFCGGRVLENVVAWMPWPEPYQPEAVE